MGENTSGNFWEFQEILNDSKNFKVIVNLGTLAYFRNNDKCLKVMNSLRILINISTLTSIYIQHCDLKL